MNLRLVYYNWTSSQNASCETFKFLRVISYNRMTITLREHNCKAFEAHCGDVCKMSVA
ncbi:MAG: hypothetical protein LBM19_00955 [Holosporales bacterium]|nr:hypothetical protein [Holosporales bacterium]